MFIFVGVSALSFIVGSWILMPRIHGTEPSWPPNWHTSYDRVSRATRLAWQTLEGWWAQREELSKTATREIYAVGPGDTLSEIARRHGVTESGLLSLNGIEEPDVLFIGQQLVIREGRPVTREELQQVDELVGLAERQLRAARFEAALGSAGEAIRLLDELPGSTETDSRRVQLELVRAEAHIAFGDSDAAHRSFERALAADPQLALRPDRASPKLLLALDSARSRRTARSGAGSGGS